jgi:hypothetical protein
VLSISTTANTGVPGGKVPVIGVTLFSQPGRLGVETVKLAAPPPPVFWRTIVCWNVRGVFTLARKRREVGATASFGGPPVTTKLTVTTTAGRLEFGTPITMRALKVPFMRGPRFGFTLTITRAGVVPFDGVTVSHAGEGELAALPVPPAGTVGVPISVDIENATGWPVVDEIARDCDPGIGPPSVALKVRL